MKTRILSVVLVCILTIFVFGVIAIAEQATSKQTTPTPKQAPVKKETKKDVTPTGDTYKVTTPEVEKWSARGKAFGCGPDVDHAANKWCSVSAPKPKEGYVIKAVYFRSYGAHNRSCGGDDQHPQAVSALYMKCHQSQRSDAEAVWEYQIQGRDECSKSEVSVQSDKGLVINTKECGTAVKAILTVEYKRKT